MGNSSSFFQESIITPTPVVTIPTVSANPAVSSSSQFQETNPAPVGIQTAQALVTQATLSASGVLTAATNANASALAAATSAALSLSYATGFTIGAVTVGTAAASITGHPGAQLLNLTLPAVTSGAITTALGYTPLNPTNPSVSGTLSINDSSTSSTTSMVLSAPSDTNGVNFKLVGNGVSTPNKWIRVLSGLFQIINSGYSASILNLDDSGNLGVPGTFYATGGIAASSLPLPTSSTIGGVKSATAASGLQMVGVDTAGNPTFSADAVGFRNRLINGSMGIDQRNSGASVVPVSGQYLVDRWMFTSTQASNFTAQQNLGSVATPVGFPYYLGLSVSSAYTVTSSDYFVLKQAVEGNTIADWGWGASGAQTVYLTFRVYSSVAGTHSGALRNYAGTRSYPFTFAVASANTWTTVSIQIIGDTSGTWVGASAAGSLYVTFNLGAGSTWLGAAGSWATGNFVGATGAVSLVGNAGATFYITGVQIEPFGYTPIEIRPPGVELALCQRYYVAMPVGTMFVFSNIGIHTVYGGAPIALPVTMRAASSCGYSNTTLVNAISLAVYATAYGVTYSVQVSSNGSASVSFNLVASAEI